jgi:hypothetical protein
MSLIGPRPERPEFVEVLSGEITQYTERLQSLPGITGLAQINLPPDTDLDSVRRKLCLDIEYIRTAGPILDFRILVSTSLRMVGVRGDAAMRLMHLQREVKLEQRDGLASTAPVEAVPTPAALKPSTRKDDRLVLTAKKPR